MPSTSAGSEIEIGTVISRVVETYKATANVLLPAALIVFIPVALLSAAVSSGAAVLLVLIVSVVASLWYTGMVTRTVEDVQDGRVDASLEELFKSVTPVLGQLLLLGILAGVGIGIGFILLIVPGLILLTIWAVAAPVVVIESRGATAALSRSRELVRGNGWTVFGVLVVVFAGQIVLSAILGSIGAISDSFVLTFLTKLALNVAVAPVSALAAAVLYFALRGAHGEATVPGDASQPAAPFSPPPAAPPAAPAITPDVGETTTDAFGNPAAASAPTFTPPVAPPDASAAPAVVPSAPEPPATPEPSPPVVPAPPAPDPAPAFDPPPAPDPAPDPEPAFDPVPAPDPAPDPEPAFDPPPPPLDGPRDDEPPPPPRTESIGPPR